MIDLQFLRENPALVEKKAKEKKVTVDAHGIIALDKKYRELLAETQNLSEERNSAARNKDIEKGRKIKKELEEKEATLKGEKEKLETLLLQIPNLAKDDVKKGSDESENEVMRTFKQPTSFSFTPKDHVDLGEALDIIDVKRATKVSGSRFSYLKGDGALLEFALVHYAMTTLIQEGFTPIIPPVLIKKEVMRGLGYMEHGGEEDMFHVDDYILVGTAEHSIVPMFKDELFDQHELPKRFVGFSTAFRREAGSYGKDTRGILRVHQFDKVEMVSFVKNGEDDKEHEYLLSLEENLFQALAIPYRVVKMCSADLGFAAARKFDLEAWMPGQKKYREVTSVSTITDFQSRRLHIKYTDQARKYFVNILNGTAFAIGRTIIAILENYQKEDGTIQVPKVLQSYVGKEYIEPQK